MNAIPLTFSTSLYGRPFFSVNSKPATNSPPPMENSLASPPSFMTPVGLAPQKKILTTRNRLARYHRKSPPSPLHQRYQNLPKERKQALQHLAGILRVADALDRSHRQNLHPSKLELRPGVCLIRSKGTDPEDAIFGLERKGDLFQQAFSLQPFLKLVS